MANKSFKHILLEQYIAKTTELKAKRLLKEDTQDVPLMEESSELSETIKKIKEWFSTNNPKYGEKLETIISGITDRELTDEEKSKMLKDRFEYVWTGSMDKKNRSKEEIDEISLTGLHNVLKKGASVVGDKAKEVGNSVVNKAKEAGQAVADKASEVSKGVSTEYHKGVASDLQGKLENQMAKIGQIIKKHNESAKKSGGKPINPQSLLKHLNRIPK
jgi:hypothetical protein